MTADLPSDGCPCTPAGLRATIRDALAPRCVRDALLALAWAVAAGDAAASRSRTPDSAQPPPPDVAAPPADATTLPSGLASKVLTPGTGTAKPAATRTWCTVHYTGWTTDGKMFDSSRARTRRAATFPLDRVIKGWSEGVQLMTVGEKRRFWIPEDARLQGPGGPAAGHAGLRRRAARDRCRRRTAPPPDVAGAARRRAEDARPGIAYKVLKAGTGTEHPTPDEPRHGALHGLDDRREDVRQLGDARRSRRPSRLGEVIPGWTEGVQLMVDGEKTRFWIPRGARLQGTKGSPAGMLVFDVELLGIRD